MNTVHFSKLFFELWRNPQFERSCILIESRSYCCAYAVRWIDFERTKATKNSNCTDIPTYKSPFYQLRSLKNNIGNHYYLFSATNGTNEPEFIRDNWCDLWQKFDNWFYIKNSWNHF